MVQGNGKQRTYGSKGEQQYGPLLQELVFLRKVPWENFEKIRSGMTESEVTAILGRPTGSNSVRFGPVGGTTSTWKDDGRTVTIQFMNGKVLAKAFSGKTP